MSEERINIMGVGVNDIDLPGAVDRLIAAAEAGARGYVCVTGAHGVIESRRDEVLRGIHNRSMITVPDGMPNVCFGRLLGYEQIDRVYGPDLMLHVCGATAEWAEGQAAEEGRPSATDKNDNPQSATHDSHSPRSTDPSNPDTNRCLTHFLYGATEEKLKKLKANLEELFPGVRIVGTYAPPFRPLNDDEERELQAMVAECRPDFFWVGLSTPKQERFMAGHMPEVRGQRSEVRGQRAEVRGQRSEVRGQRVEGNGMRDAGCGVRDAEVVERRPRTTDHRPQATYVLDAGIMIGVGAAFDIHAGEITDTPKWIQNAGLQWLHRLCREPRRLWRRYFRIVPTFLWLAFLQLMGLKKFPIEE